MKCTLSTILIAFMAILFACSPPSGKAKEEVNAESIKLEPQPGEAVATFASGCFWCVEEVYESLVGVREVISGYSGGQASDAHYDIVSSGSTDHAESVQIYYNPAIISFEQLTAAFFASHDPTTPNQQGPDRGPQYRSIAYYRNDAEKEIILKEIHRIDSLDLFKGKIVTEVVPFKTFYPAEAYHQNYVAHHPNESYVRGVSIPRFEKFKREFKGNFKEKSEK